MFGRKKQTELPLIVRESRALPFRGMMYWTEALDELGDRRQLVLDKFDEDLRQMARPSTPSRIILHVDGTRVDEAMARHMAEGLIGAGSAVQRLAIVGPEGRIFRKVFEANAPKFALAYFSDFEEAKEWLAA